MQYIQFLLKRSWLTITVATLLGLLSGVCNAKLISLVNNAVNRAANSTTHEHPISQFFILIVLTLAVSIASQFILISLSQDAICQLRLMLSRNILLSPLPHLERLGNNRLLAALTDDVRVLSHTVSVFPNLCVDLATVAGCLVYLAWLSGYLFALLITVALVAVWCTQAAIRKAQSLFAIAREQEDHLFKHFQAITNGTKELKLHRQRRDDFLDNDLHMNVDAMRRKNSHAMKIFAVADGLGQFSLFIILGITLFGLPQLINIPVPMLATYALTLTYLTMPFQNLLHRLPDLLRGNVALRNIERMRLSLAHEQEITSDYAQAIEPQASIELQNVTYNYHVERGDRGFSLGPINLSLQPGQITYLIGGNGSGKSTLAKLITGLYTPSNGAIALSGTPITDHNREWYRQHISAIFSDFYLFDRCLGLQRTNLDAEVAYYLEKLQLDHKVRVKDGVLSTTRLSQGQRKRLALLTAYLEDRPVYVFDEWASDQEPAFRELFYTDILPQLKQQGKTVVVITHDDRYFYLADQVIKLDYGKVEGDRVLLKPIS